MKNLNRQNDEDNLLAYAKPLKRKHDQNYKKRYFLLLKNRFKRILVPLDGSASSIRGMNKAISLARICKSQIIGVHVLPVLPKNLLGTYDTYLRFESKLAKQFLEKAKTSAARHGIPFRQKILFGNDTVKVITDFAKVSITDIIIIGSRGKGDPTSQYLGSVANGVLHLSKIPVLKVITASKNNFCKGGINFPFIIICLILQS